MAINFPSNPTNAQEVTEGNVTYVYNATKGYWESSEGSSGGASITVYADMTALIAATGMSNGDQAFVTANNNLYLYSGSGWYKIATVQNDSPSAITGVAGSYALAVDGTPTVITAVSTDPEGFPLTWSYSTTGLGSIATISQVDNVFTITPSTDSANVGTFTLTINATDGVNGAVNANTSITLEFLIVNSNYTTLLATAVDTSVNNNITDSSTNNYTISVNQSTNVSAGTFSPYRHGGYSYEFDGSTDSIRADDHTDFNWSSSGFTIEGWVNLKAMPSGAVMTAAHKILFAKWNAYSNNREFLVSFGSNGTLGLVLSTDGTNWTTTTSSNNVISLNTWHHICYEFNGSSHIIYVDGTAEVTANNSSVPYAGNMPFGIGYSIDGANVPQHTTPQGFVTDVRVVNGSTVYGSAFNPPTERLTAVTNTKLLTCHLPYISDTPPSGGTAKTLTINGNPETEPFTPYDNLEYSAADHGGSVSMPNDNDYLYVPHSSTLKPSGTDPFCVSFWYYPTSSPGTTRQLVGDASYVSYPTNCPGWDILYQSGSQLDIRWGYPNYADMGSGKTNSTVQVNAWNHIVFCRSGGSLSYYLNGKRCNTTTSNINISASGAANFYVGYAGEATGTAMQSAMGTIADFKYEVGTSQFDATASTITVPTAPQSTTNSVLHIKGTDASIIDKSQGSNLTLVGNTTGSTTQVKFAGSKSMYFDGTGDYIQWYNDGLFDLGLNGEPFTMEWWQYWPTIANGISIGPQVGGGTAGWNSSTGHQWVFFTYSSSTTLFAQWWNGSSRTDYEFNHGSALTAGTWQHFANVYDGTNLSTYVAGSRVGYRTSGNTFGAVSSGTVATLGANPTAQGNFSGYISDCRITKGLARYSGATITPPTAPLKG